MSLRTARPAPSLGAIRVQAPGRALVEPPRMQRPAQQVPPQRKPASIDQPLGSLSAFDPRVFAFFGAEALRAYQRCAFMKCSSMTLPHRVAIQLVAIPPDRRGGDKNVWLAGRLTTMLDLPPRARFPWRRGQCSRASSTEIQFLDPAGPTDFSVPSRARGRRGPRVCACRNCSRVNRQHPEDMCYNGTILQIAHGDARLVSRASDLVPSGAPSDHYYPRNLALQRSHDSPAVPGLNNESRGNCERNALNCSNGSVDRRAPVTDCPISRAESHWRAP